jgi:hypothetical protein
MKNFIKIVALLLLTFSISSLTTKTEQSDIYSKLQELLDHAEGKKYKPMSDCEETINSQKITKNSFTYNLNWKCKKQIVTREYKTTNINWKTDFEVLTRPRNGNKKLLYCIFTFKNLNMIEQFHDEKPKKTSQIVLMILSKDENDFNELIKVIKGI